MEMVDLVQFLTNIAVIMTLRACYQKTDAMETGQVVTFSLISPSSIGV